MYQVKKRDYDGETVVVALVATEQAAKSWVEDLNRGGQDAWYVKE